MESIRDMILNVSAVMLYKGIRMWRNVDVEERGKSGGTNRSFELFTVMPFHSCSDHVHHDGNSDF